jgi:hypothetical protein
MHLSLFWRRRLSPPPWLVNGQFVIAINALADGSPMIAWGCETEMHVFHCGIGCFSSCHFVPASHRRIPLFYWGRHGENLHIGGGPAGPRRVHHRVHDTGEQPFRSLGARG